MPHLWGRFLVRALSYDGNGLQTRQAEDDQLDEAQLAA